jgi:hypothetical protein
VHETLADTVFVVVGGSVMVLGVWVAVMDWTIVIVTVDGRTAGSDVEVNREIVEEVETPVVWLDEEIFAIEELVEVVCAVEVAVLMQEQALRIFEDLEWQSELMAEGVAIAMSVLYKLQKEDA